ncbi:MAG TPA: CapA family protein [Chitinophagaceae bacterium]|nr:CapA family protein [Chitinophagaceae bacterium]
MKKLLFLGDIAVPTKNHSEKLLQIFKRYSDIFNDKSVICNLEGMIMDDIDLTAHVPVLFNHSSIVPVLKYGNVKVACLANNHILDLPESFNNTINILNNNEILYCGAGLSSEEADQPALLNEKDSGIAIFNACFDFLLYHQKNPSEGIFVSEINELDLINKVKDYRLQFNERKIVVFLHWSLDQETLPFPMYRQFARGLVDAGADIVVGCHAHCVQGGEKYKDAFIVYGLGNFYIPNNIYAGGRLKFPAFSNIQLALEWLPETKQALCHWFEYVDDGFLKFIGTDRFDDSSRLNSYSPYTNMSDKEYYQFFKKNRRKRFLVPIYKDYTNTKINRLYTLVLKKRARIARFLAKSGLVNWQK